MGYVTICPAKAVLHYTRAPIWSLTLWYQKQKQNKKQSQETKVEMTVSLRMITPMTWNMVILKYDKSSYPEDESHFL